MKKLTKFEQFATLLAAACCVAAIVLSMGAGLPDSAVYTSGRPEGGEVRTGSYPPESGADSQSEPAAAGGKININTATSRPRGGLWPTAALPARSAPLTNCAA